MQRKVVGRARRRSIGVGFVVSCALGLMLPGQSYADGTEVEAGEQPETYPHISGELRAEIENNASFSAISGAPDKKQNLIFNTFQPEIAVEFNENLSFETEFTVEPIEDPEDFDNQEFDREGVFIEQAYLNWEKDRFSAKLGKFQPTFGLAFEASNDLFGDEYAFGYEGFSDDVEVTERLGGSFGVNVGNEAIGKNTLSLDVFQADTTNLSRSGFRHREKLDRRDGGPSNTGNPNSFGINLIGEDLPFLSGLTYHLGFVYQKSDKIEFTDEDMDDVLDDGALDPDFTGRAQRGYVGDLIYSFPLNDRVELKLLTEFLYLDNADGEANHIRRLLTVAGSTVIDKNLYVGFSYARRTNDLSNEFDDQAEGDARDFLLQTSAAYFKELGPGKIGLEVAVRRSREEGDRFRTLGFRLIYRAEF